MINEEDIILFGPKDGKSLIRMYPELGNEPAFKDLRNDDLLFVWRYANASSDVDPELDEATRAGISATIAFKKNTEKIKKFSALKFDEDIKRAIDRMKKYSPLARAIAKRIAQSTLKNYLKLVEVNVDDFKSRNKEGNTEIDWSGRNHYVNSAAKINEVMSDLLEQIEGGYGVETKGSSEATMFGGKTPMNVFHKQNDDK